MLLAEPEINNDRLWICHIKSVTPVIRNRCFSGLALLGHYYKYSSVLTFNIIMYSHITTTSWRINLKNPTSDMTIVLKG